MREADLQKNVCDDILTRGSLPVPEPSHPKASRGQWLERLPAYSGATVPASHRLPAQTYEPNCAKGGALLLAYSVGMRSLRSFLLACAAVAALAGCTARSSTASSPAASPALPGRVVTLVPSFADDAYAVGAGSQLVAVSSYTDAPQAKALPRVADAASVDDEAIVALRPTLVLGIPAQERLTEPLRHAGIRVVFLADDSYASIFENLQRIGALTGRSREAAVTIARLQRETAQLHARTAAYARHPSVFIVLGSGPIWTAGSASYISTLIALAGGTNAASDLHAAYGVYSAEALVRRQPNVLVADAAVHLSGALDREPWRSLTAVRLHRVYDVDPKIIERPGPGYNQGVRWLVDHLTPLAVATP